MPRSLFLPLVLIALNSPAQLRQVCVTVDDLPCASCVEGTASVVNDSLLAILARHSVPAVGFVNEGKLHPGGTLDSARWHVLEHWLRQGHELGNHTYGHVDANDVSTARYEADLLRGEARIRPLTHAHGRTLRWFRHPFLHAGATPQHRDTLDAMLARHGYSVAPVTLDNDEYIFAACYLEAAQARDTAAMQRIGTAYLTYMDSVVRFHEARTQAFLGHPIPHVLLLHANTLNAHWMDALLQRLEARGYAYVPLATTLADPAYALPAQATPYGFSWIRRWELAAGRRPPWPPEPPPDIMRQYEALQGTR